LLAQERDLQVASFFAQREVHEHASRFGWLNAEAAWTPRSDENRCDTHPHPAVDSLAPARSARRAFASSKFLSPFPKRLKSPPGRRRIVRRCSNKWARKIAASGSNGLKMAIAVPSPWGEGQGEGGR